MSESNERAREQARAQYESVLALVTAYELDWDRLQELRGERDNFVPEGAQDERWEVCYPDDAEELSDLERDAGDYEDQKGVLQAIREDPLSVQVRGGWHDPGGETDGDEEFEILLCTGGPAVRIVGELGRFNQADRAWLEYQDWFTGWERWSGADSDVLCRYANHFLGH